MKRKPLTFTLVIVINFNLNAQDQPVRNFIFFERHSFENKQKKDALPKFNYSAFKRSESAASSTDLLDSIYHWQWDTLSSVWVNADKVLLIYNANNYLSNYISEVWNSTSWTNSYQAVYTYDGNNNLITELDQPWMEAVG